jgi:aryl-alcohol dehydrogenase-like predicted oxidoreductase
MQTRHLGNSDLEIAPIGIGARAMGGGDWAFSWGRQEDDESIAAIHVALDAGVNWVDTAAVYGGGTRRRSSAKRSWDAHTNPVTMTTGVSLSAVVTGSAEKRGKRS